MYKERIQNTIDYIESNLKADMTAAELADINLTESIFFRRNILW